MDPVQAINDTRRYQDRAETFFIRTDSAFTKYRSEYQPLTKYRS